MPASEAGRDLDDFKNGDCQWGASYVVSEWFESAILPQQLQWLSQ